MPDDFLPPPDAGGEGKGDLLEQLLVVAAEKAAKKEAHEALTKGFVTRGDINAALSAFGDGLESRIVEKLSESLMPKVVETVKQTVETVPGLKKSTIQTPEDEMEADPVKFMLKKAQAEGPESYTQTEKDILWGLTKAALSAGMNYDEREED